MQPDQYRTLKGLIGLSIIVIAALASMAVSVAPAARARAVPRAQSDTSVKTDAPTLALLVTSSSNSAITTCAGAPNDCSLRGAVQLANASASGASIHFSSTVTLVTLSSPVTLTHNNIGLYGNGHEVTRLKISGNFPALVVLSNNNVVNGLWINATAAHAGTSQHGILINSNGNIVNDNSLSDLGGSGVLIQNGSNNWIAANFIGVQTISGVPWIACSFQNDQWGIRIVDSPGNDIDGNTIGCNAVDGVGISGANSAANKLHGNHIGVAANNGRVPNTLAGVALWGGAHDNLIGDAATQGNTVAANGTFGVYVGGAGTNSNRVQLNTLGISTTIAISNAWGGLTIQTGAQLNLVFTNTIAFNGGHGVYISGAGANDNLLSANTIRANLLAGVAIDGGAVNNTVGNFGARTLGNVISGNGADGVYIAGAATAGNWIINNNIGANAAGNAADPNRHSGVVLDAGTYGNAIGWIGEARNVIAGNAWDGILMINGAHDNAVFANDIGTNRDFPVAAGSRPDRPTGGGGSYLQLPNGGGISIAGAYTNTIGAIAGFPADNFIYYNTHTGIYLSAGSHHNTIGGNTVRANGDYGILLDGGNTAYNTITRTLVDNNRLDGIGERNNAGLNVWTEVGLHSNGGLGIDKSANNDGLNTVHAPYVFFDSINKITGVVQGHADPSVLGTTQVELYRVLPDPSGFGEGWSFVGRAVTDASGDWTITDPTPAQSNGCYTALVTESQFIIPFSSSEFSANTCRVFLPTVHRQ